MFNAGWGVVEVVLLSDELKVGDRFFSNRLFVGTGKYASNDQLTAVLRACNSQVVTVALRRVNLSDPGDALMKALKSYDGLILPNTSGAKNSEEAVRLARLAASVLGHKWVKLEITPHLGHLLPDPVETYEASKVLCKEGFSVMPYINADPVLAKKLEDLGCVAVMPLASPIGTNRGLKTLDQIRMIIEDSNVPVVVDAGIGRPSHASLSMEIGADAVLVNTAIAVAKDPVGMATAFDMAVKAGRLGFLSGLAGERERALATSPLTGFLGGTIS